MMRIQSSCIRIKQAGPGRAGGSHTSSATTASSLSMTDADFDNAMDGLSWSTASSFQSGAAEEETPSTLRQRIGGTRLDRRAAKLEQKADRKATKLSTYTRLCRAYQSDCSALPENYISRKAKPNFERTASDVVPKLCQSNNASREQGDSTRIRPVSNSSPGTAIRQQDPTCCRTATPLPPGDALRSDLLPNRRLAPFERGVEKNRPVVDPPPRPLPMILLLLTTELPLGRDGGWKRCDEEVPPVPSRHS